MGKVKYKKNIALQISKQCIAMSRVIGMTRITRTLNFNIKKEHTSFLVVAQTKSKVAELSLSVPSGETSFGSAALLVATS